MLSAGCHAEDTVTWAGYGLPGSLTSAGAPANTTVTSRDAFALVANGRAALRPEPATPPLTTPEAADAICQ